MRLSDGMWGIVCDFSWVIDDCNVICKMLGHQNDLDQEQDMYGSMTFCVQGMSS